MKMRRPLPRVLDLDVGSASVVGGRTENQDRCYVDERLAVVSDGMGGYRGGALAAQLSVDASVGVLSERSGVAVDRDALNEAFAVSNDAVRAGRDADPDLAHMGATLTIAVAADEAEGRWLIGHVGDSPAYVITRSAATQVTVDHTAPAQLVAAGMLTEEQAAAHHGRHMLLRAIGVEPTVEPDVAELVLRPGDVLVLCSDGLSGTLTAAEVGGIVRASSSAEAAAVALTDAAVAGGATDNVTAVVVRRRGGSPR